MSILSGLEKFGLGKMEEADVYEKEKASEAAAANGNAPEGAKQGGQPAITEAELLFDKKCECPVCDEKFLSKTVRTGRIRMISQDTDLRQKYPVDVLKYDAIVCPNCGYAALNRFFKYMQPAQAKLIQENISKNFHGLEEKGDVYTYDEAIERHKLALVSAVVKKAADSEKAYICLKTAWLFRGKAESLPKDMENYKEEVRALKKQEIELLNNACEGFSSAYSKEDFPMCGMDELTLEYLMADLCRRTGRFDESGRYISRVLTNRSANERIKNKARDVKELLEKDRERLEKKK